MKVTEEDAKAVGTVAISDAGAVQLEFLSQNRRNTVQWELVNGAVLESLFDADGGILRQKLHENSSKEGMSATSALLERFAEKEGIFVMGEREFREIKLKKGCPKCGKEELKRELSPVPVMPIYICSDCDSRSYHLTDDYLEYLVENNKELFDGKELQEMSGSREKFTAELKEYVIRIFASKRIACIK